MKGNWAADGDVREIYIVLRPCDQDEYDWAVHALEAMVLPQLGDEYDATLHVWPVNAGPNGQVPALKIRLF